MKASKSLPTSALEARLLATIEAWCARNGMSAGAFGAAALRDRDFVPSLRRGRNPRLRTVDSILAFMDELPAGPAFLREVEAILAVTGIERSLLGRGATGNPSFVAQLRKGVSPTLATVRYVRVWMASRASADEWREIRARTGAMPRFLTNNLNYRVRVIEPHGGSGGDVPALALRERGQRIHGHDDTRQTGGPTAGCATQF